MKKSLFLIPCLAAALWSCSDKDVVGPNEPGQEGGREKSYLSVSISNVLDNGTRATYDGAEEFEDGSSLEWAVEKVRFFFFDTDGDAAEVVNNGGTMQTYFDYSPAEYNNGESPNIEKKLNVTIVLDESKGDDVSAKSKDMVAVLNPTDELDNILSYSDLETRVLSYNKLHNNETKFVMTNSVYVDGTIQNKVDISAFKKVTPEAALLSPVEVYVERVAAKASINVNVTGTDMVKTLGTRTFYKLQDNTGVTDGNKVEMESSPLYIELLGWNVTALANESYAIKNLDDTWTSNDNPFNLWNGHYSGHLHHRSYWAKNPSTTFVYGDFDSDAQTVQGWFDETGEETVNAPYVKNYTYMPENAYQYVASTTSLNPTDPNTATPTKIIVAAQLVDESGNVKSFAVFGNKKIAQGEETVDNDGWDDLKKDMVTNVGIYVKTTDPDGTTHYTSLKYDQIELKTAQELGNDADLLGSNANKNYLTFAQIYENDAAFSDFEDFSAVVFTFSADDEATTYLANMPEELQEVNKRLATRNAKIYEEGRTYYYFNIKHINTAEPATETSTGYYGVVRNHWYYADITGFFGLGTPVYDETETVYPQTPEDDPFTYVAAEVKILSWRKVDQGNVDLGKQ